MPTQDTFTLRSDRPRRGARFENNAAQNQRRLFVGTDDLRGQLSLFDADGRLADDVAELPALTIRQPWAGAILAGEKRVENRSWSTNHRGPLLIHAAARDAGPEAAEALEAAGVDVDGEAPRGAVIGVVDLVDVVRVDQRTLFDDVAGDPLATGPYCWILANPRPLLRPVPYRGQLGLFAIPVEALGGAWPG